MVITKKLSIIFLLLNFFAIELYMCSFLRRYGVNSPLTNIPLFFNQQNKDEPQRANPETHHKNQVVVEEEPKALDNSAQEPDLQESSYQSVAQMQDAKTEESVDEPALTTVTEFVALETQEIAIPKTEDTEKNEGVTPVRRPRHIFHKK